jgi:hypothetical protein
MATVPYKQRRKCLQSTQEESHEIFGVPFSYTVIHPPTMMIKPSHTAVADAAMLGSSRPE